MARDEAAMRAWSELRLAFVLVSAAIARALEQEGVGPAEVGALYRLATAPSTRLRMGELAGHLAMVQSGITRVIDRLEERGWVTREQPRDDRRSLYATLTPEGRAAFRRLRPVYERAVAEQFGAALSAAELALLRRIVARLLLKFGVDQQVAAPDRRSQHRRAVLETAARARRTRSASRAPAT